MKKVLSSTFRHNIQFKVLNSEPKSVAICILRAAKAILLGGNPLEPM